MDETEFVRQLAGRAIRDVKYHENGLRDSHRRVAVIRAVLERGQYTEIDVEEIEKNISDFAEEESVPVDSIEFVRRAVIDALFSVHYHEDALCTAHEELAGVKAMILRGKYEFTINEVEIEEAEKRRKKQ